MPAYFERKTDFAGHSRKFATAASTAYAVSEVVSINTATGYIRPMTATDVLLGICQEVKASSDTTNDSIEVEILFKGDEVLCPVSTGTPAQAEIGNPCDVVTGGQSVNLDASSNDDFYPIALDGASTTTIICTAYTTVY